MVCRTLPRTSKISSLGFSGAGFLASYHLGVVKCFQQQQGLLSSSKTFLPLTGVSAGALVSSAVAAGVEADDGMEAVLEVAAKTRQAGRLAAFAPGFSLVDCMENAIRRRLYEAIDGDEEEFLKRIQNGRLLRIGLTDRREWPPVGPNPRAVCYVDHYRGMEDVIASCVLSSYVPGVTGPAFGSLDERHTAILRAAERLKDMVRAGCVKKGVSGEPLRLSEVSSDLRELYWDGGLVNAFPIFDKNTIIVTPIAADFVNPSINPSLDYSDKGLQIRKLQANPTTKLHLTSANLHTFRSLLLNTDESNLQSFYARGYDNCLTFLDRHGLLQVFTRGGGDGHQAPNT